MVKSKVKQIMVGFVLTIIFAQALFSQENLNYSILKKYSKWGIVLGPVLYNQATLDPQYGEYTFENKPMWGFNTGIEYNFYQDKKWSVSTGLIIALEPVYSIKYTIKAEDIYPQFENDCSDEAKMYAMTSFSFPFLFHLNIQISDKVFMGFQTGLKAMYFPPGSASYSITFHNEDNTASKEVFGLRAASPDNQFQGSFVIGTSISYAVSKVLFKTNIIYVINFQNAMEGEYLFDNMFVSSRSYGYYKLSGNYIGLLFTISFTKIRNSKSP